MITAILIWLAIVILFGIAVLSIFGLGYAASHENPPMPEEPRHARDYADEEQP